MINSITLALMAILLTSLAQLLLKKGSVQIGKRKGTCQIFTNWIIIGALLIFLLATIFSVLTLRQMPLNVFYSLSSLSYFIVIFLSIFLLKEPFSINKLIGCLTIITGILIYNI